MRRLRTLLMLPLFVAGPGAATADGGGAVRFCLDGEFDLGTRFQGMTPEPGEFSPATWCVITEGSSGRVQFHARGKSNPDMSGAFTVNYVPPDTLRIVNRESPPDVEFHPADVEDETGRNRRIDPRRLVEELEANPAWIVAAPEDGWQSIRYPGGDAPVRVRIADGKLRMLETRAALPLRGEVPVTWSWAWPTDTEPRLTLSVDGTVVFAARGRWQPLGATEAAAIWAPSGNEAPHEAPGDAWPARTNMRLEALADGVWLVRGVRTGFHHLVVDTAKGLVVGDAPAGWVELPQIPPADLVPGLGISGLSERFIDFLRAEIPGRPIRAVALTHAHDDHAGGARAFAAAGADVYAPAATSAFLTRALNRPEMPDDRFSETGQRLRVKSVEQRVRLDDAENPVELVALGPGPHASASLGMLAPASGHFFQSDLHVPTSEAPQPRGDRLATECWFARWATANLEPDTVVISSHGNVRSPVSRLEEYLASDGCRRPGDAG